MPDPFSVSTTLAVPVWAVIALALALFVLLIWAALPLLSKPVASRWPFANPDANALLVAMVILGTLLFLGAVGAAFTVLLHTFRVTETGGAGPNLGAGALIAALLGAPFLIWGTVLKHQTVRYQKEGHMTDRIAKAVEMLGAEKTVKKDGVEETKPNLEVRIGAILSLERIAQDSTTHDKGRDHVRVMEILCAYIRENAPASSAQDHALGEWEPLGDEPNQETRTSYLRQLAERLGDHPHEKLVRNWAHKILPPREDVAQALRVIGRRSHRQLLVEAAWPCPVSDRTGRAMDTSCPKLPDSEGSAPLQLENLEDFKIELRKWVREADTDTGYRLDLRGVNLQNADMADCNFQRTRFANARLEAASFWRSKLDLADFSNAKMQAIDLRVSQLNGARLLNTHMEGADLTRGSMIGADFLFAQMEGAIFWDAVMEAANFRCARLDAADLRWSRIGGADLRSTRMNAAKISETIMNPAVDLSETTFQYAGFKEIDLSEIPMSSTQILKSFGDTTVILAAGTQRPRHWPTWVLPLSGESSYQTQFKSWLEDPDAYVPPPPPESS